MLQYRGSQQVLGLRHCGLMHLPWHLPGQVREPVCARLQLRVIIILNATALSGVLQVLYDMVCV